MWRFTHHTCENSVFHCTSVHCLQHCAALACVQYSLLMGAVWFNSTQQWGQQVHGAWTRGHLGPDWQTWQSEAWFVWTEAHQSSDVTFEVLQTIFLKSFKTSIVTLCVLLPLKRIMEMKCVWWWLTVSVQHKRRSRLQRTDGDRTDYLLLNGRRTAEASSRFSYCAIILV